MQRIGDIELDQDLDFEYRQWRVQRAGWVVMVVIVVAALIGLFGTGPLSSSVAGSDDSVTVAYERFIRRQGEAELTIGIAGGQATEGQVELWLDAAYHGEIQIQQISPEPEEVRSSGDRVTYVFAVDDPAAPVEMSIQFMSPDMGRLQGEVGIGDQPGVSFTQFSYP